MSAFNPPNSIHFGDPPAPSPAARSGKSRVRAASDRCASARGWNFSRLLQGSHQDKVDQLASAALVILLSSDLRLQVIFNRVVFVFRKQLGEGQNIQELVRILIKSLKLLAASLVQPEKLVLCF
jgi:hypothetical protein